DVGLIDNVNIAYSLCIGDLNNDGYPDVIQSSSHPHLAQVYENSGGENNFIKLAFEGVMSNKDGVGTRVKVYANEEVYSRQTHCGEGYLSQNSSYEFIGLGSAEQVDSLTIIWPLGFEERYYDVQANQAIKYVEGESLEVSVLHQELDLCSGDEAVLASSVSAASYLWNGVPGDSTLIASEPGEYILTCIHDQGFEFSSEAVIVSYYPESETTVQLTQPTCLGQENGSIQLSNSIGLTSVVWLDQESNEATLTGVGAGEYFYAYNDLNGCFLSGSAELPAGAILAGEVNTVQEIFDVQLGAASASISGGVEPYIFDWSSGCQNPVCPNLSAGVYSLNVLDQNGCELLLDFEIDGVVGLNENSEQELVLAPNPVTDVLKISTGQAIDLIQLRDVQGRLVLQFSPRLNQFEIDFSGLQKGMYHLVVNTSGAWYSQRVIRN
ncbi:MAG: ASPIC/UnbV domain-containing protein, partial [Flavobacteriales bacterium]